jgi:hypothetical protein
MVVLEFALSNAVIATLLAIVAAAVGLVTSRPQVAHVLWVLVLLKLVTPPLVRVPVRLPDHAAGESAAMPLESSRGRQPDEAPDRPGGASAPSSPVSAVAVGAGSAEVLEAKAGPAAESHFGSRTGWLGGLFAIWGAGSIVWLGLALHRLARFRRVL